MDRLVLESKRVEEVQLWDGTLPRTIGISLASDEARRRHHRSLACFNAWAAISLRFFRLAQQFSGFEGLRRASARGWKSCGGKLSTVDGCSGICRRLLPAQISKILQVLQSRDRSRGYP